MTFAFGMNQRFQDAYRNGTAKLRYALMESMSGPTRTKAQREANEAAIIQLRKMKANKFAIGSRLGKGAFNHWLVEQLSGLNVMCDICIPNTCWSIRWVLIRWWFAVQQTLVRPQLRITTRTCSSFEATRVLPIFILKNSCVSIATSLFATGLHNIRKPTKYKWVISTRPINGGNVTSVIALNLGNAATSPINVAQ